MMKRISSMRKPSRSTAATSRAMKFAANASAMRMIIVPRSDRNARLRRGSVHAVQRVLVISGAIVVVDMMFFAALTPFLPGYADEFDLSKARVGLLQAAYPLGASSSEVFPAGIRCPLRRQADTRSSRSS